MSYARPSAKRFKNVNRGTTMKDVNKLRQDMKRYAAGKRATKVATLQSEGASGRAELKRMRDVWYDTDKSATPGQYYNPKGKAHVVGRDQKARNILKGHQARQSQGRGI